MEAEVALTKDLHVAAVLYRRQQALAELQGRTINFDARDPTHVNVSFVIPEAEQRVLVKDFPELEFFFTKASAYNGHAFAAVTRQAINRYVKYLTKDTGPVVDLGGNPMTHLHDDHIHTCTPVLSTYDENRRLERQREIHQHRVAINKGHIANAVTLKRLDEANRVMNDRTESYTDSVCSLKSQHCTFLANTVVAVDSIYDITVEDFIRAMISHQSGRAVVAFIEPTALLLGATEGQDKLLGVSYSFVGLPSTDGYISNHADTTTNHTFHSLYGNSNGGAIPAPRPLWYHSLKPSQDDIMYVYKDGTVYIHSPKLLDWSRMANDGVISFGTTKVSYHKDHLGKRCGYTLYSISISTVTDVPVSVSRATLPADGDYRIVLNWLSRNKHNVWTVTRPMIAVSQKNWQSMLTSVKTYPMCSSEDLKKTFEQLYKFAIILSTRFIYRGVTVAQNEHIDTRYCYLLAAACIMYAHNEKSRTMGIFETIFKRRNGCWRRFLRWMFATQQPPGMVDHQQDDVPFYELYQVHDGFNPLIFHPNSPVIIQAAELSGKGKFDGQYLVNMDFCRTQYTPPQPAGALLDPEVIVKLSREKDIVHQGLHTPAITPTKPGSTPPPSYLSAAVEHPDENVIFDAREVKGPGRLAPAAPDPIPPPPSWLPPTHRPPSAPPRSPPLSVASMPFDDVEPGDSVSLAGVPLAAPEVLKGPLATIGRGRIIGDFVVVSPDECPTQMSQSLKEKMHKGFGTVPPLESHYVKYVGVADFADRLAVEEYLTVLVSEYNDTIRAAKYAWCVRTSGLKPKTRDAAPEGQIVPRDRLEEEDYADVTHVVDNGLVVPVSDAKSDFVLVHPKLRPFYTKMELDGVATIKILPDLSLDLSIVNGVPGCGKTRTLIKSANAKSSLIVTSTRATKDQILDSKLPAVTATGAIISGKPDRQDHMLIDELYMIHYGCVVLVAHKYNITLAVGFGDACQVPWVCRCYLQTSHAWPRGTVIANQTVSHRLPRLAVLALKDNYETIHTTSKVIGTFSATVIASDAAVDMTVSAGRHVLTFTQADKKTLNHHTKEPHCNTIHEAQGQTHRHTVVVRLNRGDQHLFSPSQDANGRPIMNEHMLVGISRATHVFEYQTVVPDFYYDLINRVRTQPVPEPVVCDDRDITAAISRALARTGGATTLQLDVVKGDLLSSGSDVLVNAANPYCHNGGGIARAFRIAAGEKWNTHVVQTCANNPIPVSGILASPPGNLPCKCILNAVGPNARDSFITSADAYTSLKQCITNILQYVDDHHYNSVSIPMISSQLFAVDWEICRAAYHDAVKSYKPSHSFVVKFVDTSQFKTDSLRDYFGSHREPIAFGPEDANFSRRTSAKLPKPLTPEKVRPLTDKKVVHIEPEDWDAFVDFYTDSKPFVPPVRGTNPVSAEVASTVVAGNLDLSFRPPPALQPEPPGLADPVQSVDNDSFVRPPKSETLDRLVARVTPSLSDDPQIDVDDRKRLLAPSTTVLQPRSRWARLRHPAKPEPIAKADSVSNYSSLTDGHDYFMADRIKVVPLVKPLDKVTGATIVLFSCKGVPLDRFPPGKTFRSANTRVVDVDSYDRDHVAGKLTALLTGTTAARLAVTHSALTRIVPEGFFDLLTDVSRCCRHNIRTLLVVGLNQESLTRFFDQTTVTPHVAERVGLDEQISAWRGACDEGDIDDKFSLCSAESDITQLVFDTAARDVVDPGCNCTSSARLSPGQPLTTIRVHTLPGVRIGLTGYFLPQHPTAESILTVVHHNQDQSVVELSDKHISLFVAKTFVRLAFHHNVRLHFSGSVEFTLPLQELYTSLTRTVEVHTPAQVSGEASLEDWAASLTNGCWVRAAIPYLKDHFKFRLDPQQIHRLYDKHRKRDASDPDGIGTGDPMELIQDLVFEVLGLRLDFEFLPEAAKALVFTPNPKHWDYVAGPSAGYHHKFNLGPIAESVAHHDVLRRGYHVYLPDVKGALPSKYVEVLANSTFVVDLCPAPGHGPKAILQHNKDCERLASRAGSTTITDVPGYTNMVTVYHKFPGALKCSEITPTAICHGRLPDCPCLSRYDELDTTIFADLALHGTSLASNQYVFNRSAVEAIIYRAYTMTSVVIIKTFVHPDLVTILSTSPRPLWIQRLTSSSPFGTEIYIHIGETGPSTDLLTVVDNSISKFLDELAKHPKCQASAKDHHGTWRVEPAPGPCNVGPYSPHYIKNVPTKAASYQTLDSAWTAALPYAQRNLSFRVFETMPEMCFSHPLLNSGAVVTDLTYPVYLLNHVRVSSSTTFSDDGTALQSLAPGLYAGVLNRLNAGNKIDLPPSFHPEGHVRGRQYMDSRDRLSRHFSAFHHMSLPMGDLMLCVYLGRNQYEKHIATYLSRRGLSVSDYTTTVMTVRPFTRSLPQHIDSDCNGLCQSMEVVLTWLGCRFTPSTKNLCVRMHNISPDWFKYNKVTYNMKGGGFNDLYKPSEHATRPEVFEGFLDVWVDKTVVLVPPAESAVDLVERILDDSTTQSPGDPVDYYWVASEVPTSESPVDSSFITDPVPIIQAFVDDIVPGNSTIDNTYDNTMIELGDMEVHAESVTFSYSKAFTVPKPPDRNEPVIRTGMPNNFTRTAKSLLNGFNKRNANPPVLTNDMSPADRALVMIEQFKKCCCVENVDDILEEYRTNPLGLNRPALNSWTRKLDNSTKPAHILASLDTPGIISAGLEEQPCNEFDLALKTKPKVVVSTSHQDVLQKAQTVLSSKPQITAIVSSTFQELQKRVEAILSPEIMVVWSRNSTNLEASATQHFSQYPPSEFQYTEMDISSFDKSQLESAHIAKMTFYRMLGLDETIAEIWDESHVVSKARDVYTGVSIDTTYQHKSGDATTLLGNTLMNLFVYAVSYQTRPLVMMAIGDDSLFCAKPKQGEAFAQAQYSEMGNFDTKRVDNTGSNYFCGMLLVEDELLASYRFVRDPIRVAIKLGSAAPSSYEEIAQRFVSLQDEVRSWDNVGVIRSLSEAVQARSKCTMDPYLLICALLQVTKSMDVYRSLWSIPPERAPAKLARYVNRLAGSVHKRLRQAVRRLFY